MVVFSRLSPLSPSKTRIRGPTHLPHQHASAGERNFPQKSINSPSGRGAKSRKKNVYPRKPTTRGWGGTLLAHIGGFPAVHKVVSRRAARRRPAARRQPPPARHASCVGGRFPPLPAPADDTHPPRRGHSSCAAAPSLSLSILHDQNNVCEPLNQLFLAYSHFSRILRKTSRNT